jgi:hypothetical protein
LRNRPTTVSNDTLSHCRYGTTAQRVPPHFPLPSSGTARVSRKVRFVSRSYFRMLMIRSSQGLPLLRYRRLESGKSAIQGIGASRALTYVVSDPLEVVGEQVGRDGHDW